MESELSKFLRDAGLADYIEIFELNRIGMEQVDELSKEDVAQMIPLIGDLKRFQKAVENRKSKATVNSETVTASEIFVTNSGDNDASLAEYLKAHELTRGTTFYGIQDFNNIPEFNNTLDFDVSIVGTTDDVGNYEQNLGSRQDQIVELTPLSESKKRKAEESVSTSRASCTPPKQNYQRTSSNLIKTKEDLENYLSTCPHGEKALKIFKKEGKLNNIGRDALTTSLEYKLVADYGKTTNAHYDAISKLIPELFPRESATTYYIAPQSEGRHQKISKGKLLYKHRNLRTANKANSSDSTQASSKEIYTNTQQIENLLPEQELIESQKWLQNFSQPWPEVLKLWQKTAPNRISQLTKINDLSIATILKDWPLLKHPLGYTLVCSDFKISHPTEDLGLLTNWAFNRDKILNVMSNRARKDKHGAYQIVKNFSKEISEDSKDVVALHLLPALLPAAINRQKGLDPWKPSIAESQDGFILHAKSAAAMQSRLQEKKKRYESLKRPIQPCVVIVGESLFEAKDFYVVFETITYKMDTALSAVDTCFKLIHALNLIYPIESKNVWLFLERHFYGFSTKPTLPCCVSALISEL